MCVCVYLYTYMYIYICIYVYIYIYIHMSAIVASKVANHPLVFKRPDEQERTTTKKGCPNKVATLRGPALDDFPKPEIL